ncbi:MAG: DegT/DnrJ/EryC1/StrS family aminotransferase [Gammaproteobacteria bacterium]|nr:DegT/DnrJ/EryC1/StrS family aminotransferase [Gammaproteobacteria bacterium]
MSPTIPILDLTTQYAALQEDIEAAALRVLRSGRYVLGPEVEALETELGAMLGIGHVISCASGTDALCLSLRALDVGPGDEVLVPAFTFAAPAEAVALTGARPVFVDIDPDSFLVDPESCRNAITSRTRAAVVVHLYGRPADISAVREAIGPDVAIVEDCAQSFGARTADQATGTFGQVASFSFFPSKNLGGCGDGGAVATGDPELAARLRALRNHGSSQPYHHETLGLNSRLDELQAAVLRVKLPHVAEWNEKRRQAAGRYTEKLQKLDGIQPPAGADGHVWHQYTLLSPQRDAFQEQLSKDGIESRIYYPIPLHRQEAYTPWADGVSLPAAEQVCDQCLSLPMFPELSPAQIEQICASLARAES